MYPVSHGSAVACTARRRPNRRQSIHSAISHDLLERKGNLPRVVARTQTVYAHQAFFRATRGEQEICVNVKLLTRENEGNCRTVIHEKVPKCQSNPTAANTNFRTISSQNRDECADETGVPVREFPTQPAGQEQGGNAPSARKVPRKHWGNERPLCVSRDLLDLS